jgi:hypothetical protein
LLVTCLVARAVAAGETTESRAARYFAEGLETSLLHMRAGTVLVQACKGRLRSACGRDQLELAAGNQVITLLDALTLFPQRLDVDPAASAKKPQDLRRSIQDTSAELLRTAGDYDARVFARYGAAMTACPYDEDAARFEASLDEVMRLELVSFRALSPGAADAVTRAVAEERAAQTLVLRQWPAQDCVAARKLGEYLVQLMAFKLQPWRSTVDAAAGEPNFDFTKPKRAVPQPKTPQEDRELAHAVAGNFVAVVATELQLQVFPETEPRIKELAEQAGVQSKD